MNYELKQVLKSIINEQGVKRVYSTLDEICDEWREFFGIKEPKKEQEKVVSFSETIEKVSESPSNAVVEVKEKKYLTKDEQFEKKTKHVEMILAKLKEQQEKGLNPKDSLTEENLKKWIEAGETYWSIAEKTGVPDTEVAAQCRKYGLKSSVALRIASRAAMKKREASLYAGK